MLPGERGVARGEVRCLLRQIELAGAVQRLALRLLLGDARLARGERLLPLGQARDALFGGPFEIGLGRGQLGLALVQPLLLGPEAVEGRAETLLDLGGDAVEARRRAFVFWAFFALLRFFEFLLARRGLLGRRRSRSSRTRRSSIRTMSTPAKRTRWW